VGHTLKATLSDTTCTTNMAQMQNVILEVSSVLTASNRGEEIIEVRGGREQQRGEENYFELLYS
jgi:hypothetical protein